MKNILLLIPVVGLVGFSFFQKDDHISTYHFDEVDGVNYSVNPPPRKTGAPGEGTCTDCHVGAVMSGDGVIDFTIGGGPTYLPGQVYPITISAIGGGIKNGFELAIKNSAGEQAGTFEAGTNTSVVESVGIEYVRQSTSLGITSWTFDWTAPDSDMGELTAYYTLNITNNNGLTGGDEVFLGSTVIPADGAASINENQLDKAYNVFFNEHTRELNVKYALTQEARVVLNIQDLSGRLVEYYDFGNETDGAYAKKVAVTKVDRQGVYLVSLFINNNVLNRKVVLN